MEEARSPARSPAAGRSEAPSVDRIESRLEFETLISDTSAALVASRPQALDVVVERALERVRAFFRADRCALLLVGRDRHVVHVRVIANGDGVPDVPAGIDLAQMFPWLHRTVIEERTSVRVARIEDLPPEADGERASWIGLPVRAALLVPVETAGIVSHLIVLNSVYQDREWPEALVTRLRVLGELLVGALDRRSAEEALQRSEARLASAAELAELAFYEVRLDENVMFVDERFRAISGLGAAPLKGVEALDFWLDHVHPDDRPRLLAMRAELHEGRTERVSIEYRYVHPERGTRWIHHLGRVAARDASGRAVVAFGVMRDITELKRVEDELRDLSGRLIRAHEEQRALLARELHDDLTQRLAVLAIDVGRAELSATGGAQAEALSAVRQGLVRLSEDVHALAYQLHPSVLEDLGLADALRAEGERTRRQGGVEVAVEIDEIPASLERDTALCLFRVAQEALANATRHARSLSVSVVLRRIDDGLLLAVRDDGVGFDPRAAGQRRSLGLASMRERLQLVRGTLDVESAPGAGTTIVAWTPIRGAA